VATRIHDEGAGSGYTLAVAHAMEFSIFIILTVHGPNILAIKNCLRAPSWRLRSAELYTNTHHDTDTRLHAHHASTYHYTCTAHNDAVQQNEMVTFSRILSNTDF
jgi:hypothetical protein